jgi:hypothetical protein
MLKLLLSANRASGILLGAVVGAGIGMLVLPRFIPLETVQGVAALFGFRVEHWGVLWLLVGTGGAVGLVVALVVDAIRQPHRKAAQKPSATYSLQERMAGNFPALLIGLHDVGDQWIGGVRVVFARASLTQTTTSFEGTPTGSTQTVVYYERPGAAFPHFRLAPKGPMLKMAVAMGLPNLRFADQPEFEEKFLVLANEPLGAQALLDSSVRAWLLAHPDIHLEAGGSGLLAYRLGKVLAGAQLQAFVLEAAELLRLADQRRGRMEARPTKPTEADELRAFAMQMPGYAGRALQKQLEKQLVSRQQVDEFLRQAPPRKIPFNLAHRYNGAKGILAVGMAFVGGAAFFMVTMVRMQRELDSLPFMALFMLGGLLMVFFSGRFWWRSRQLLRWGEQAVAKIQGVKASGWSDSYGKIFSVAARFHADGQERSAWGRGMGSFGQKAAAGQTATILYQPGHPERIVFVDALVHPPDR